MSYIKSEHIEIFPTALPRATQRGSRLLYEDNIANIIRQLVDKPSFIITHKNNITSNTVKVTQSLGVQNADIEFCIYGYYVKIKKGAMITEVNSNTDYINVSINLTSVIPESESISPSLPHLLGQDDSGVYEAVNFIGASTYKNEVNTSMRNGENILETIVEFTLLQKTSDHTYELCPMSYRKFDSFTLQVDGIDGKHN